MVSFSCENCGDVLTKKKLDGHRNQCYGASYTCLDCMVHFQGTSYKSHTACITEDQKYQGKLYKEKKPKPQHQKKDSAQNNSQALVPRNPYVEDAPDGENAVAIVDAPPRAPSPPPAAFSLGYNEQAQIEDVNVFDFLDQSETPNASRVHFQPVDESRMLEDSIPPAYEETQQSAVPDVMAFQVADDSPYNPDGFSYGTEPVRPTSERYDSSYNFREQDPNFITPAPKSKHSRTKSKDKDIDASISKTERKRKRSPTELDMSLVHAQQERDVMMADAPPMLHSGLTGGLNRLLAAPGAFPPSPDYSGDYVENSPLSPMKRAKQGSTKAFARAQREWEIEKEKERKADIKEARERAEKKEKKEKEKERGRDRERKERKSSTSSALVKIRHKKRRDDSARGDRKHRGVEVRRRNYSSSPSPPVERKMKAIEYHPSGSRSSSSEQNGNGALIVRESGQLAPVKTLEEARADLFLSCINKGPESERGMSVNKALKRFHRERHDRWDRGFGKGDEEKELWKSLRLKKNERGEIVVFFSPADS